MAAPSPLFSSGFQVLYHVSFAAWNWPIACNHSMYALQGKSHLCNPFLGIARCLSPNIHIHVSTGDLYIPTIDLHILLQEICGPILGIYGINRSKTHECENRDWGRLIPRKGIHKWDFRCSAYVILQLPETALYRVQASFSTWMRDSVHSCTVGNKTFARPTEFVDQGTHTQLDIRLGGWDL